MGQNMRFQVHMLGSGYSKKDYLDKQAFMAYPPAIAFIMLVIVFTIIDMILLLYHIICYRLYITLKNNDI